jgi:protein involved in polysaccharide export with SLBB domain
MPSKHLLVDLRPTLFLVLGILCSAAELQAQQATPSARVEATRAELEAIAAHPPKGMLAADVAAVQSRLANGDFAVGDKIAIQVQNEPTLSNTFTVSGDRSLLLPSLPPLPLAGVLRSESDSVITAYIARFIRDPQVTVQPLLRLGVLGGVGKPGYYEVPSTSLVSEVVMAAGGMGENGTMEKAQVYRGKTMVLDSKSVTAAITKGSTLDLLNLQSGDNLQVGETGSFKTTLGIVTAVLAIPLMIVTISSLKHN